MELKTIAEQYNLNITEKKTNNNICAQYYLQLTPTNKINKVETVLGILKTLYDYFSVNNIVPLHVKCHTMSDVIDNIEDFHNCYFEGFRPNLTCLQGHPCIGGVCAGIQIIAVIDQDKLINVANIYSKEDVIAGVVLETDFFKEIYLERISMNKFGISENSKSCQAEFMFEKMHEILGDDIHHVVRTWIYFPDLLSWYDDFNKARMRSFTKIGFLKEGNVHVPASTGIQGLHGDNDCEACFMDVLVTVPKNGKCETNFMTSSTRQNEAAKYGSLFSRGVEIKYDDESVLHISGTASINSDGETIYKNDPQGQIFETFMSLSSLLKTKNAKLSNICSATAYCKNMTVYNIFCGIIEHLQLDRIPFIPVIADVCRDDLLFEIDCVAITRNNL